MKKEQKGATFSKDHRYRYDLTRIWDARLQLVMFIGLNPSTADAEHDDPTIRRCMGFARRWGYGGLLMGNLYALVSTDPKALLKPDANPISLDNDMFLLTMHGKAALTVAAWGSFGTALGVRSAWVRANLPHLSCLGVNKDGEPKHPLYLPLDAELFPWPSEINRN